MAQDIVTTWDIAQDIAANWTEGRCVSELPECWDEKNNRVKYPAQVFREWMEGAASTRPPSEIDRPDRKHLGKMLKAARIKLLAPPEYGDRPWSLYAELPADADADRVADIFTKAAAQPIGVSMRGLRLAMGTASGLKRPYWQQVLTNLMDERAISRRRSLTRPPASHGAFRSGSASPPKLGWDAHRASGGRSPLARPAHALDRPPIGVR